MPRKYLASQATDRILLRKQVATRQLEPRAPELGVYQITLDCYCVTPTPSCIHAKSATLDSNYYIPMVFTIIHVAHFITCLGIAH